MVASVSMWAPWFIMFVSITFAFGGEHFLDPRSKHIKPSVQHIPEELTNEVPYAGARGQKTMPAWSRRFAGATARRLTNKTERRRARARKTNKTEHVKPSFDQRQADEFKLLDRNGDGVVHVHELEEVKKKLKDRAAKEGGDKLQEHESSLLGKLEKDHVDWHVKLDGDGNGHVTLEEHKQLWAIKEKSQNEKQKKKNTKTMNSWRAHAEKAKTKKHIHDVQKQQFETMDADSDGRVSKQEMVATMNKLKARKELDGGKGLAKHEDSLLGKLEEGPENIHDNSDANGDGHLTWDEYKFKKPGGPQPAEL